MSRWLRNHGRATADRDATLAALRSAIRAAGDAALIEVSVVTLKCAVELIDKLPPSEKPA